MDTGGQPVLPPVPRKAYGIDVQVFTTHYWYSYEDIQQNEVIQQLVLVP